MLIGWTTFTFWKGLGHGAMVRAFIQYNQYTPLASINQPSPIRPQSVIMLFRGWGIQRVVCLWRCIEKKGLNLRLGRITQCIVYNDIGNNLRCLTLALCYYSLKIEWIIPSIFGVKRFHSLRITFHSILTPVEWKFTTQRAKSRPGNSIYSL